MKLSPKLDIRYKNKTGVSFNKISKDVEKSEKIIGITFWVLGILIVSALFVHLACWISFGDQSFAFSDKPPGFDLSWTLRACGALMGISSVVIFFIILLPLGIWSNSCDSKLDEHAWVLSLLVSKDEELVDESAIKRHLIDLAKTITNLEEADQKLWTQDNRFSYSKSILLEKRDRLSTSLDEVISILRSKFDLMTHRISIFNAAESSEPSRLRFDFM